MPAQPKGALLKRATKVQQTMSYLRQSAESALHLPICRHTLPGYCKQPSMFASDCGSVMDSTRARRVSAAAGRARLAGRYTNLSLDLPLCAFETVLTPLQHGSWGQPLPPAASYHRTQPLRAPLVHFMCTVTTCTCTRRAAAHLALPAEARPPGARQALLRAVRRKLQPLQLCCRLLHHIAKLHD